MKREGVNMKKKRIVKTVLICIFTLCLILEGCHDDPSRGKGGNGGGGKLTIQNKPLDVLLGWGLLNVYKNPETPIMTSSDLLAAISPSFLEATAMSMENPYDLRDMINVPFKKTGKFMVVTVDAGVCYIVDVNFSNGSATVDWNTMKKQSDLPLE